MLGTGSQGSPRQPDNLIASQRNTEADPARIELATLCLGSSRTSVVLRADQRRGSVRDSFLPRRYLEAAAGIEPACSALQADP